MIEHLWNVRTLINGYDNDVLLLVHLNFLSICQWLHKLITYSADKLEIISDILCDAYAVLWQYVPRVCDCY